MDSLLKMWGCCAPTAQGGPGDAVMLAASRRGVPNHASARLTPTDTRRRPPPKPTVQTTRVLDDEARGSLRAHSDAFGAERRHDASSTEVTLQTPSHGLYESQAGSRFSAGESTAISSGKSSGTRLTYGKQTGTTWVNEVTTSSCSKHDRGMSIDECHSVGQLTVYRRTMIRERVRMHIHTEVNPQTSACPSDTTRWLASISSKITGECVEEKDALALLLFPERERHIDVCFCMGIR